MKKLFVLVVVLCLMNGVLSQVKDLTGDKLLLDDASRTLKAATSMCVISFLYESTGAVMMLEGLEDFELSFMIGLTLGIGGVGMATNNAILTNRAYNQIKELRFSAEDSILRMRMLRNIKSARILSIIQNLTPVAAVVAGSINYLSSKSDNQDEFIVSSSFWIPTVSVCAIGLLLTIPEIVLIREARKDLNTYQRKLTLGTTFNSMGIRFRF